MVTRRQRSTAKPVASQNVSFLTDGCLLLHSLTLHCIVAILHASSSFVWKIRQILIWCVRRPRSGKWYRRRSRAFYFIISTCDVGIVLVTEVALCLRCGIYLLIILIWLFAGEKRVRSGFMALICLQSTWQYMTLMMMWERLACNVGHYPFVVWLMADFSRSSLCSLQSAIVAERSTEMQLHSINMNVDSWEWIWENWRNLICHRYRRRVSRTINLKKMNGTLHRQEFKSASNCIDLNLKMTIDIVGIFVSLKLYYFTRRLAVRIYYPFATTSRRIILHANCIIRVTLRFDWFLWSLFSDNPGDWRLLIILSSAIWRSAHGVGVSSI